MAANRTEMRSSISDWTCTVAFGYKKTTFITKNGYKYIVIAVPTKLFFSTAYKNNNGYKNKRLGNKRFLEHPRGSSKCYMYKSTTAYKNIPGDTRIFILQKIFINHVKMTQFEKQDNVMKENILPDRMELISSKTNGLVRKQKAFVGGASTHKIDSWQETISSEAEKLLACANEHSKRTSLK